MFFGYHRAFVTEQLKPRCIFTSLDSDRWIKNHRGRFTASKSAKDAKSNL